MFTRGTRFPNAKQHTGLEIDADSHNRDDTYETVDSTRKAETIEGTNVPSSSGNELPKPSRKASSATGLVERYNALQKKLDDLEQVHADWKKSSLLEQDRLKQILAKLQKENSEQLEQLAKGKKQNEILEARVQELKKASGSDQVELKDLRTKFRLLEHERSQLASKQVEAAEAKKSFDSLDARRRDEIQERDRRIVQLEQQLESEKKRREAAEARVAELKSRSENTTSQSKVDSKVLEVRMKDAHEQAKQARRELDDFQEAAEEREHDLLDQLHRVKMSLEKAALEYGRLATESAPAALVTQLKLDLAASELREAKLERRLANTEDQVIELAHLIRQTKNSNHILSEHLQGTLLDLDVLATVFDYSTETVSAGFLPELYSNIASAVIEHADSRAELFDQLLSHSSSVSAANYLLNRQLIAAYSTSEATTNLYYSEIDSAQKLASSSNVAKDDLTRRLEIVRAESADLKSELVAAKEQVVSLQRSEKDLQTRLEVLQANDKTAAQAHADAIQRERTVARKAASSVQQLQSAQEGLIADNEKLTAELMDAIQYQDAYTSLLEEVQSLMDRNTLAEEETTRLSKFNAEILGHHNPSQKIMYVERVRTELAEAKQKLLVHARENEALLIERDELRAELDMYKSVAVPTDNRPRTGMTRVVRAPLNGTVTSNRSQSTSGKGLRGSVSQPSSHRRTQMMQESVYKEGDLTVDDLS